MKIFKTISLNINTILMSSHMSTTWTTCQLLKRAWMSISRVVDFNVIFTMTVSNY